MNIGIVSDTHGLLRPQTLSGLAGSDLILHAGDVGRPEVLETLSSIAPVRAVRGNVDVGAWAAALPLDDVVTVAGKSFYLVHDIATRDEGRAAGCDAVVYGHSHKPRLEWVDGVLHLNPGSVGPRRFRLPIAMACVRIDGDGMRARAWEIDP